MDSEREREREKKMSKKVILSAQQSGKAGVFSDQLLTRLMVIFLHRHRFTVKGPSLHGLSLSFFFFFFFYSLLFSVRLCSLHLPSLRLPYLLLLHIIFCFSTLTLCFLAHYPPQPPNAAVSDSSRSNSTFFRAHFLASVSWHNSHHLLTHTHTHTVHTQT